MGHKHTIEYRPSPQTVYLPDPALQKKIDEMKTENKQLLEEVRKFKDPEAILEVKEQQLQNYL